jgi:hypothetical protein
MEKLAEAQGTAGTRRLGIPEFLSLPSIFERALRERGAKRTFTIHDFLPRDEEVTVGSVAIPGDAPAAILRGSSFNFDRYGDKAAMVARAEHSPQERILEMIAEREVPSVASNIPREARGSVERSVAKKLGVPPELVAIASERRWGESLTTRRNSLIPTAPPEDMPEDQAKGWRNAIRGHATRQILGDEELLRTLGSLRARYDAAIGAGRAK